MEVTRKNFESVLDTLQNDINGSTFLTIDTEFTGLEDGTSRCSGLDTPAERYQKVKQSSMQFLIVQFGLSTFKCDKSNKITYKTYNFYVFPTTVSKISGAPDIKFLCQASCISFLSSHGFDFNKLFREGVPFVSLAEEEKLRSNLLEKYELQELSESMEVPEIPVTQKVFVEDVLSNIEKFLAKEKDETENILVISDCNAYQRKLILSHGRKRFPDGYFESKRNPEKMETVIVVQKAANQETKQMLRDKSRKDDEKALTASMGFSKVIRMISESKKPVVGHNMLLDLCYIIQQFYSPLPEDYEDFKLLANTIFPRLVDTKVMASTQPLRDFIPSSGLEVLAKTLSKQPFKFPEYAPALGFPSYDLTDKKAHEAGYDSFVTGLCFASMLRYLNKIQATDSSLLLDVESAILAPFFQKVFLMMVSDIPYLSLGGPDVEPNRDHVFHLTFPKAWKAQDIYQLFNPSVGHVRLNWIGETSCFVSLTRKELKDQVLTSITLPDGCTIQSYNAFRAEACTSEEEGGETHSGNQNGSPVVNIGMKKRTNTEPRDNSPSKKRKNNRNSNMFEVSNDWN